MANTQTVLQEIAHQIEVLEEEHNNTLDGQAHTKIQLKNLRDDITRIQQRIQYNNEELRDAIHQRIHYAKRITKMLSLLAQQEDVNKIENRIQKQPYEQYATTEWFRSELTKLSKRS